VGDREIEAVGDMAIVDSMVDIVEPVDRVAAVWPVEAVEQAMAA